MLIKIKLILKSFLTPLRDVCFSISKFIHWIIWNPNLLYRATHCSILGTIVILIEILFISALSALYITMGLGINKASDTDNLPGGYNLLISFINDGEETGDGLKRPVIEIEGSLEESVSPQYKRPKSKITECERDKKICIEYIKSLELKGKFGKMTLDDLYNNLFKKNVFNQYKSNKATNEHAMRGFYEKLFPRRDQFQLCELIKEDLNINPDKLLRDKNGDFVIILLPKYPIKDCNCFMEQAKKNLFCHCLTKNQWVAKYTTGSRIEKSDIQIYDPFLLPRDFDITSCKKLSEFINHAIEDLSNSPTQKQFNLNEILEGEIKSKRKLTLINRVYGHKNLPNDPIKTIEPVLLCTSKPSNYFKGNSRDVLYSQFGNVPIDNMGYSLNNKWGYRMSIIKEINPSILESIWDNLNDKKPFHGPSECVALPIDKYIVHKSKVRSNEDEFLEKKWEKYDSISSNFKHHYAFLEGYIKDYLQNRSKKKQGKGYNIEPILKKLHYIDKKLESHIKQSLNIQSLEDYQGMLHPPCGSPSPLKEHDEIMALSYIIQKFNLDKTNLKFEDNDKPSVMEFHKEILTENRREENEVPQFDKFFLAKNIIDIYTFVEPSITIYKIYGKKYEEDISLFQPIVVCNTVNQFNEIFQTHLQSRQLNELCNSHLDPLVSSKKYHKNNLELVVYRTIINTNLNKKIT